MGTIFKADGTYINDVKPANGTDYQLEELQAIVGGSIEIVHLHGTRLIMVINEEGKFEDPPRWNALATFLALERESIFPDDFIAGDVLLCGDEEVR